MELQRKTPSVRWLDLHYILMQAGFWAMFASIVAYQTALLLERGFTNGEAGLMTAVRCLAGIVCQPLLGGFADRHPEVPLKWIVSLSLVLSLGAGAWYWLSPGMGLWETTLVWAVIGGLEVSSYPLMDAMAVQFINDGVPIRYSLGRGIGSLAYAVVCVLLGLQVGRLGLESTLLTHLLLVVAEAALVAAYPPYRGEKRTAEQTETRPQSALSLLRSNPRFTLMLAGVLLGLTGIMPLSNFLVNIVTSRGGQPGGSGAGPVSHGGLRAAHRPVFRPAAAASGQRAAGDAEHAFRHPEGGAAAVYHQLSGRAAGAAHPGAGLRPVHPGVGIFCQ